MISTKIESGVNISYNTTIDLINSTPFILYEPHGIQITILGIISILMFMALVIILMLGFIRFINHPRFRKIILGIFNFGK